MGTNEPEFDADLVQKVLLTELDLIEYRVTRGRFSRPQLRGGVPKWS